MGEERKKYDVVGTVTISTEEYRDLVKDKYEAEKSKEYYYNKYWEYERKCKELDEENNRLRAHNEQYKRYIKDNGEQDKMELWLIKISREED